MGLGTKSRTERQSNIFTQIGNSGPITRPIVRVSARGSAKTCAFLFSDFVLGSRVQTSNMCPESFGPMRYVVCNVSHIPRPHFFEDLKKFDERLVAFGASPSWAHFVHVPGDVRVDSRFLFLEARARARGCEPGRKAFIVAAPYASMFQQACWSRTPKVSVYKQCSFEF